VPAFGFLLAATAAHHPLRRVTRNEKDFTSADLEVVNPWATRVSE
jgi:predicted nucleic acid-binding protein